MSIPAYPEDKTKVKVHCRLCRKAWLHTPGKIYRLIVDGCLVRYCIGKRTKHALCPEHKRDKFVQSTLEKGYVGLAIRQRVKKAVDVDDM